jgi:hypothetical protein
MQWIASYGDVIESVNSPAVAESMGYMSERLKIEEKRSPFQYSPTSSVMFPYVLEMDEALRVIGVLKCTRANKGDDAPDLKEFSSFAAQWRAVMTRLAAKVELVDVIWLAEAVFLICGGSFPEANMSVNEAGTN